MTFQYSQKKSRSARFTAEELNINVDTIEEFPELNYCIFNSRFHTKKEYNEKWRSLAQKLTASNMGIKRTGAQVRSKWCDLKYRIKQKCLMHKHMQGAGEGEVQKVAFTPLENRIIEIIGLRCLVEITDSCDSTVLETLQNFKQGNISATTEEISSTTADNSSGTDAVQVKEEDEDFSSVEKFTVADEVQVKEEDENSPSIKTFTVANEVQVKEECENSPSTEIFTVAHEVQVKEEDENSPSTETITVANEENLPSFSHGTTKTSWPIHESDMSATTEEIRCTIADNSNGINAENLPSCSYAAPKTSWPIHVSSYRSTQRGRKHRELKRKKIASELEKFEMEALNALKNMCSYVEKLANNVAQIVPAIAAQQNDVSCIKDIFIEMNKNIKDLVDKIDKNNKLLQGALNLEKE